MYHTNILNPDMAAMLARFRHTNCIVISDLGFPFWPVVPTVDVSLTRDIPSVRDILRTIGGNLTLGNAWMADEFRDHHGRELEMEYRELLGGMEISFEPHVEFKKRVPACIGLIRTGDSTAYGNIILESA